MSRSRQSRACPPGGEARGFTLVEMMVTVVVVAILASIAIPIYKNYVLRGKLTQAFGAMSAFAVSEQQYYQDNRSYAGTGTVCGAAGTPAAPPSSPDFTYTCGYTPAGGPPYTGFTVTATGSSSLTSNFTYTLDQNGGRATTHVAPGWNVTIPASCWVMSDSGTCY